MTDEKLQEIRKAFAGLSKGIEGLKLHMIRIDARIDSVVKLHAELVRRFEHLLKITQGVKSGRSAVSKTVESVENKS